MVRALALYLWQPGFDSQPWHGRLEIFSYPLHLLQLHVIRTVIHHLIAILTGNPLNTKCTLHTYCINMYERFHLNKMVNNPLFLSTGHSSQTYMENAVELVRIIRHFVTEMPEEMDIFTETVSLQELW